MLRKLLSILFFSFALNAFAQNDITIGLVMPEEELDGIKPDAFKLLQSKLEKLLTSTGVASFGGDFVMYPVVNFLEEDLIEGGIKNFYKVKIELSLNVVNCTTKTLFASETWPLLGTGDRFKSQAVKNAFSQLKGNDSKFKDFIEKTKEAIYTYYKNNKAAILSKAKSLASTGDYEQSLAMLSNYPPQVSGYSEAQTLIKQVYIKYIDANGAKILNEARAAFASGDYESAANIASQIDPESTKYSEAKTLINQIRQKAESEKNAANQRAMKALEIAADVEKNRINAAASVAKAYYSRRVVNYNVIRVY